MISNRNKRIILITGGCGYIGSQFIRDLAMDDRFSDFTIRILDNMQEENHQALMNLPSQGNFEFFEGDILDPNITSLALEGVEIVFHLAAVVRTPMSFTNATWVEQVNHWGTARLIGSCFEAGVNKFVFASSAAVYGPGGPFNEQDICRPFGAYAQSKYKAEAQVIKARKRGLKSVVFRFGTVFGLAPVVRFDAVANRFAYLAGTGRSLTVFGQGDQIRPFIHVRDASALMRLCLQRFDAFEGKIINGVSQNASILEIVQAIQHFWPSVSVSYTEQDVLTHLSIQVENTIALDLGWNPEFLLQQGLHELVSQFVGLKSSIPAISDYL